MKLLAEDEVTPGHPNYHTPKWMEQIWEPRPAALLNSSALGLLWEPRPAARQSRSNSKVRKNTPPPCRRSPCSTSHPWIRILGLEPTVCILFNQVAFPSTTGLPSLRQSHIIALVRNPIVFKEIPWDGWFLSQITLNTIYRWFSHLKLPKFQVKAIRFSTKPIIFSWSPAPSTGPSGLSGRCSSRWMSDLGPPHWSGGFGLKVGISPGWMEKNITNQIQTTMSFW